MPITPNQENTSFPWWLPKDMQGLIESGRQTLHTLTRWRCGGFDCAGRTLDILDTWTGSGTIKDNKDNLTLIQSQLGECRRCTLSRHRHHIMFGQGSPNADLVFVVEAPSLDEDRSGQCCEGPAGQLLLKMVAAMNLRPESIYIAYMVKCRSQDNLRPTTVQASACLPFLKRQLQVIHPKVICALGEGPSRHLLGKTASLDSLRGRLIDHAGGKLMATYDPSHLIAHPEDKKEAWQDLKKIMAYLGIAL